MANSARRIAVMACFLAVASSCFSAEARPCKVNVTLTQLCVVGADGKIEIDRLAATNLVDPSQDIRPDPENPYNRLVGVQIEKEAPLTATISPKEASCSLSSLSTPRKTA